MTDEHVELNSRQEALESRVLLLCPTIGWWKGMLPLPKKGTETVSDGKTVDKDDVTTPRAKLMTDKYPCDRNGMPWTKRLGKIENRLTSLKDAYSVPFPINGVRIVPKARGQALMDAMYGLTIGRLRSRIEKMRRSGAWQGGSLPNLERQLEAALMLEGENAPPNTPILDHERHDQDKPQSIAYDLHMAATEFCGDWARIREEISQKNDVFEQVASRVPTNASLMRQKFYLDVVPIELAGGSSRTNTVTADDLEEHQDLVRNACQRNVNEAIEMMIQGPRQELADALANLKNLIARDGKVTQRSFDVVRTAIGKVRMFDFVANDELLSQISQLETRLDITRPMTLDNVTAANSGFTAAITGFMNEVSDAQIQARDLEEFGRDFRAIDID